MAYPDDPAWRARVIELLGTVWPGIPRGIARAAGWGADWFAGSTPFARFVDGRAASHVGVIPLPLSAGARDRTVAAIHAVCTHPELRGRGHYRAAMEEALAFVDARWATALLWTDEPPLYERFGFVRVQEHVFRGAIPQRLRGGRAARALDPDDARDLALVSALLRARTPVSAELAARDPGWVFLLDLAFWTNADPGTALLHHLEDLDCVAVARVRGGTLHLYDLVAAAIPPLDALLARLAGDAVAVEVHFAPDRLGGALAAHPRAPPEALMVRGDPLPSARPLALSPFTQT